MQVGYTSASIKDLLIYKGPASSPPASAAVPKAKIQTQQSGDTVEISDAAKAASEAAGTLSQKVKAQYDAISARGSSVTFDISKPGELPDLSSFTDDELAKISIDRAGEYSKELSDFAEGALGTRLKQVLEPYESAISSGDRRGHAMTINLLYEQMSPDTRAAMGWTPAMMASNNKTLDWDNREFGAFDMDQVKANLLAAARAGGLSYSIR